jgi:hypothetical protein
VIGCPASPVEDDPCQTEDADYHQGQGQQTVATYVAVPHPTVNGAAPSGHIMSVAGCAVRGNFQLGGPITTGDHGDGDVTEWLGGVITRVNNPNGRVLLPPPAPTFVHVGYLPQFA